jgi:hypothetical protein
MERKALEILSKTKLFQAFGLHHSYSGKKIFGGIFHRV